MVPWEECGPGAGFPGPLAAGPTWAAEGHTVLGPEHCLHYALEMGLCRVLTCSVPQSLIRKAGMIVAIVLYLNPWDRRVHIQATFKDAWPTISSM